MNDDSVDAMRYYVEQLKLDRKKKYIEKQAIRNALLDVLIILSTILLILVIPTKNLGAILCSYIVLAIGNIRRFIFN